MFHLCVSTIRQWRWRQRPVFFISFLLEYYLLLITHGAIFSPVWTKVVWIFIFLVVLISRVRSQTPRSAERTHLINRNRQPKRPQNRGLLRTPLTSDCIHFRLPPLAERLSVPIPLPASMSVTQGQPLFWKAKGLPGVTGDVSVRDGVWTSLQWPIHHYVSFLIVFFHHDVTFFYLTRF